MAIPPKAPAMPPHPLFALRMEGARCVRCRSFCTVNCGEQAVLHRLQIIKPRKNMCSDCAELEGYDRDFYQAAEEVEALCES